MARFKFSMESVAKFRQQEKKLKEIELAFKRGRLDEALLEKGDEQRKLDRLLSNEIQLGNLNPEMMLAHRAHIETQRNRVLAAIEIVGVAQQEWLQAERNSQDANVNFEVLEQLRTEKHQEHLEETAKSELIEQSDRYLRLWALKQETKPDE